MSTLVVVGAQWGDEGKGKLVDYLTARSNFVVRFQGGNNAGHTLVVDGRKFKLSLVPSGILRKDCRCLISAGVVVDPEVLLSEFDSIRAAGVPVTPDRLLIDRESQLILAYHKTIDKAREEFRGEKKLGTTGRGIGPAYEERAHRVGIRFAELFDLDRLKERFFQNVALSNQYLKDVLKSSDAVDSEREWANLQEMTPKLLPYIDNVSLLLDKAIKKGERVLFEGAQGTLLDQIYGTVPYVTSSHTLAGAATVGCGIGPKTIDYVLGVAKAYTTRVGTGPFPTELHDDIGEQIRKKGAEFGTVTGRPRRCGWLDIVALRRAVRLNGLDSLVITKLDVLGGLEKVKICTGYSLDGQDIEDMPAVFQDTERIKPTYLEVDGWGDEVAIVKNWRDFPSSVKTFLSIVSDLLHCPISVASVGPERESTIFSGEAGFLQEFLE